MAILRCLICDDPVLGGARWEVRLCSIPCATEALFEIVRLETELDASDDEDGTTRTLFEDLARLHRRHLLMRAALAWHELDEPSTPGGVDAPARVDADEDAVEVPAQ